MDILHLFYLVKLLLEIIPKTYVSFEQLRLPKGTKLEWKSEGIKDFSEIIPSIDTEYITLVFGKSPGVRQRAVC